MLDNFRDIERDCPEPPTPVIHDFPELQIPPSNLEKNPHALEKNVPEQPIATAEKDPPMPMGCERTFLEYMVDQHTDKAAQSDDLSGAYKSIARLIRMEREGARVTTEAVGYEAGAAVLDQYYAAKHEVTRQWGPTIGVILGLSTLVAGIATDISIFGGALEKVIKDNYWFAGLAAGSLIFAAGTSFSESPKLKTMMRCMMIAASLGASMLAADDPNIKNRFANMLPDSMRASVNTAIQRVEVAQVNLATANKNLEKDQNTLTHGGIGGQAIFSDHYPGNDAWGHKLEDVIIPADKLAVTAADKELALATSDSKVESANDPSKWWGQILGALYLTMWLVPAQFGITSVIDLVRKPNKDVGRGIKGMRVKNLESSRGKAEARAQVYQMLRFFQDGMVHACKRNPVASVMQARLTEIDQLFSGQSLQKATDAGVEIVIGAVHPRRQLFEDGEPRGTDRFWAVLSRRKNPPPPAPKP